VLICILCYPTCEAHAPYNHLRSALLYNFFPHNLIKSSTFLKEVIEYKLWGCIFSTNFAWNISHSKKTFLQSTHYSWQILMKLEQFWQNFKNPRILNFMKFRPVRTEVYAGGQTKGNNKTNSAFAIFSKHLNNPESSLCPGSFCLQLGYKPLSKL